ncbi:hypothetical protein [Azotobacter salinestris]|uniref:hypothetical protein n=1 Tax=Azotobacter salinestris TaxID=69964 RepID=UPI001266C6F9|nr:hypothetical protein [Azotobacter salinestris]
MLRRSLLVALLGLFLNGCAAHDYDHDSHRHYSDRGHGEYPYHSYDGAYRYRMHEDHEHRPGHRYRPRADHRDWHSGRKVIPYYNGRQVEQHGHRQEWRKPPAYQDERRDGYSRMIESKRKQRIGRDRHADWDRHHPHRHSGRDNWHERHDRDGWPD